MAFSRAAAIFLIAVLPAAVARADDDTVEARRIAAELRAGRTATSLGLDRRWRAEHDAGETWISKAARRGEPRKTFRFQGDKLVTIYLGHRGGHTRGGVSQEISFFGEQPRETVTRPMTRAPGSAVMVFNHAPGANGRNSRRFSGYFESLDGDTGQVWSVATATARSKRIDRWVEPGRTKWDQPSQKYTETIEQTGLSAPEALAVAHRMMKTSVGTTVRGKAAPSARTK